LITFKSALQFYFIFPSFYALSLQYHVWFNICNQRALASYIKRYACSNAKMEDLWAVLEEESGEPVQELMNSWTKQKGYPVISVKLKDQKLEFEQVCAHQ